MTSRELRWLLLALGSGLLTFVVIRRRQQIADVLPQPFMEQAERFVIPWTSLERRTQSASADAAEAVSTGEQADELEDQDNDESMQRKVSSSYRISFRGKRYGPLPESLVGTYVEVETRDGTLFVLHEGTPIANFKLQS